MLNPDYLNLKGRVATIGKTSKEVIEEIQNRGVKCTKAEYSVALTKRNRPKLTRLYELGDKIISEWEEQYEQRKAAL